MNKTVFKVYFNDEIHRISIADVTFSELLSTITNLFPSFNRASHQLKYLDEEGELISVCSDIELEDALEQYQNKPLRLYVVAKDKPLNPEQLSSYLTTCSSGELAETSISQVTPTQELADATDLNALEEVQKEVAGEVQNLNQSFQQVRDEELKKNFLKPLIDELFKALFVVTKTLKEMFEKKWISMKEYMEARVAFFREEMRKFKLKVREMFQKLGDKIKGPQPEVAMTDVEEVERQVLSLSVTEPIPLPNSPETTEEEKTPLTEVEVVRVEQQPIESTPVSAPVEEQTAANEQVEKLVQQLVDMGFTNRQQNRSLIEKHRGDLLLVINDLV